jgi:hypothetical protein
MPCGEGVVVVGEGGCGVGGWGGGGGWLGWPMTDEAWLHTLQQMGSDQQAMTD